MSHRKRGFDPLSSLFEVPDPAAGVPLPDVDDDTTQPTTSGGTVEVTDPFFKAPSDHVPLAAEAASGPITASGEGGRPRRTLASPRERAPEAPPDPLTIARAVGRAAANRARVEGPKSPAEESISKTDVYAAAREAAAREAARRSSMPALGEVTPPYPEDDGEDDATEPGGLGDLELDDDEEDAASRALDDEDTLRSAQPPAADEGDDDGSTPTVEKEREEGAPARPAGGQMPARAMPPPRVGSRPTPRPPEPVRAREPSKQPSRPASKPAPKQSPTRDAGRETGLASRLPKAQKAKSALEAAREAATREAAARESAKASAKERSARPPPPAAEPDAPPGDAVPPPKNPLAGRVAELLPRWLPAARHVDVRNAMNVDQRDVLVALWKAHRAKFSSEGELERAVGAAAVLHALTTTPAGNLVAAHVVTEASDYLVWLDIGDEFLVAAFADARSYFAGV